MLATTSIRAHLDIEPYLPELRRIACTTDRDGGATRRFYSYPAKFLAHLPRRLIERFTRPDDLVLDVYSGGGTTALEAMLLGRRFVGHDINPFANLVARVKTRRIDPARVIAVRDALLRDPSDARKSVLDADDRTLLGDGAANVVEQLAARIDALEPPERDLFRLALIHTLKMLGRRDRANADPLTSFAAKTARMAEQMAELPGKVAHAPRIVLASNHRIELDSGAADLLVTSPPYKDLDVEYMQLQIQRPQIRRSKRSEAIARVLDVPPVDKRVLCGGRGAGYWDALMPSLKEARRVLREGAPAFWWIGFKTSEDRAQFESALASHGFTMVEAIEARLSHNRAASSRSTHHGRATGMMQQDLLYATRAG